jgi:thioredoxin-related protein
MKLIITALLGLMLVTPADWLLDFEQAKLVAKNESKYIVLNFSGSDWCGPCIRMTKDIFESDQFLKYAKEKLVLVNADFPRSKKHALPAGQQKKNDQLADIYNKEGIFPLTLLLTSEGKIVKTWEGFQPVTPEEFTKQIDALIDAGK